MCRGVQQDKHSMKLNAVLSFKFTEGAGKISLPDTPIILLQVLSKVLNPRVFRGVNKWQM